MSRARVAGMPSNKALRRQALQLAQGGVQSKRSITRQYKRAQGDTAGFTSALVSLLKGEQGTAGAAYGQAVSQQQQIDQAARQQLGNLGEDYGGAAVKVGATGDSAISGLLAGQAAASDYASRQPGIAAGRGALAQTGLENALQDALSQRADAIHQAFGPAYQSVRQNAFNESMALQNLGLQKSQLALQAQSLGERAREFDVRTAQSDKQFWASLAAQYGGKIDGVATRKPWESYNMTPTQWRSAAIDARQGAQQAEFHGVTVEQYLDRALKVNLIPPELALQAVKIIYGGLKGSDPKTQPAKYRLYQDYVHWLQSQPAYQRAQEKKNQRNRVKGARGPAGGA